MIYWPVVLLLVTAPFATWGGFWLERQHLLASQQRTLTKERAAAYDLGKRDGIAWVRDQERSEIELTREVIREVEKVVEVPPATPAEVMELCRRSASCRERRELK